MSIFFIIIIGILLFEYTLNCMVSYLNLGALDPKLPEEFIKTFDEEKYIKTQEYTRVNTKYSFLTSTLSLVISLSFIFGGVYNEIDLYVRSIGFNDIIITGLCFFGILTIISDILTIPFSLYKTFVIEERFGFNKMKLSTFFIDKIKGYLLMILMGGPLLYSILYFFENFTEYGWLYVWILLVSFSIIIQPIFNIFIAPLFNKFTPLEEGPLLDKIKAYLAKVNFPVKKLEVMDGSKRSSHSNAYFSGIGSNKRIALFDTLVEQMDDDEIVSIIAHEVGHYKLKHIYTGIVLSAIQSGVMFYIMSLFLLNEELFSVFKMDNLSIYASLLFFSMLYAPISMILGVFFSAISRRNEFSADAYSVETAKMPNSMISSLKKLSKENLSNLTPHWLNVFLNYSHPPVLDRLNAIRELEK
jgi:STE24 endopeptidase